LFPFLVLDLNNAKSMEKHLHSSITPNTLNNHSDPIESMQQLHMEKEFANELAVLKSIKLEPRKEAVEQLLHLIAQKSIAAQH
jgi:hypothetical protein